MADENKEQEPENQVDLSGLGSFDFTPDWAKGKPDDKSRYARFEGREERAPRRDGDRRGRRGEAPVAKPVNPRKRLHPAQPAKAVEEAPAEAAEQTAPEAPAEA